MRVRNGKPVVVQLSKHGPARTTATNGTLTQILVVDGNVVQRLRQTLLELLQGRVSQVQSIRVLTRTTPHLDDVEIGKVPIVSLDRNPDQQRFPPSASPTGPWSAPVAPTPHLCANHAVVTMDSFSLIWPKAWGLSVMTTTAFCTVDRVTSGGRLSRSFASIWRVHEMPNSDVARRFSDVAL